MGNETKASSTPKTPENLKKFILAWKAAGGTADVAAAMGWGTSHLAINQVRAWRTYLKKIGVRLKRFPPGRRTLAPELVSELQQLSTDPSSDSQ